MNRIRVNTKVIAGMVSGLAGLLLFVSEAKADCAWTVSGTLKVETQEPLLRARFGSQIALKGVKVKVSGATVASIFDSWGEVTTNSNGEFTIKKDKSCENRKLRIEVKFENDGVAIRDAGLIPNVPWFTIVEDSEKRREAGSIQILPTVFNAGKLHDLNNSVARHHADIWVIANTMRDQLASYGAQFKYKHQSIIKYPNNEAIAPDSKEASFTHPVTHVVNVFKSADGKNDHMSPGSGVPTLYHEMAHAWAFEHSTSELDTATNLIATGSTHCHNTKEQNSFHEGFAEFVQERLEEEIFGSAHTLPFNRDALKSGLQCESGVDKITTLLLVEQHEFGWMSLFRMLTTDQLSKFTYAGDATSTNRLSASVFISPLSTPAIGCSNPTHFTLKNVLDVFLAHSANGFSNELAKSEMNIDSFMARASKILKFEDQNTALKNLLDPAKTTEPRDEFCGNLKATPVSQVQPRTAAPRQSAPAPQPAPQPRAVAPRRGRG